MKNYIELALRTESKEWYEPDTRLLHAAMGLVTETAELMSSGTKRNWIEELGDVLWYVAIACDTLEISIEEAEEAAGNFEALAHLASEDLIISSAEILDVLKKSIFYGKPIPTQSVVTHLGRIIRLVRELGEVPLEEIMVGNIHKLEKRFPHLKFNQSDALNRDVDAELSHI